jgi:hypothetical protein
LEFDGKKGGITGTTMNVYRAATRSVNKMIQPISKAAAATRNRRFPRDGGTIEVLRALELMAVRS